MGVLLTSTLWPQAKAGGIVASRQTFRNYGIVELSEGQSVLATQIYRDLQTAPRPENHQLSALFTKVSGPTWICTTH